ncbi:hypothetical protein A2V82_00005 [candidate division KSB1 bacterium RBG_16_48_16]|nr:MAG: hypothetical protein A2V82_00005 [candidate division KSB1 bacterium RBG_16_48_16]
MKNILIVDDEESVRYSFKRFLSRANVRVDAAKNGAEAFEKLSQQTFDLVILDVRLPDMTGLQLLQKIKAIDPKLIVLIITAFGTTETAIEAIKLGAYDYILKPFDIPSMKNLVEEALQCSHLMRTQVIFNPLGQAPNSGDDIIGSSQVMQEVYKMIGRVAESEVNILLRGESGTGKELVARAIYQHSQRSQKPFLAVNCAAIPETLLESELFGFEKGAFTGAIRRKIGKFERANGGTIFLDEIGDMTLSTQAKILRVLQEGCFERLGGDQSVLVDVRVIAATNKNLERAIEEGLFREDLYYRIKVITITLPPLRLRKGDILELIHHFLDKHCKLLKKNPLTLTAEATECMLEYHWPGNIRELENTIRRAIVLCKGNSISAELFLEEFQKPESSRHPENKIERGVVVSPEMLQQHQGQIYRLVIEEAEKKLLIQVLQHTSGNQVQAAKILGISRVMLRNRIAKYSIKHDIISGESSAANRQTDK